MTKNKKPASQVASVSKKNADIELMDLSRFVENSYLNYSMYVILDRALPHLADGLKPVQRRIIFAMSELSLSHTSKHKKSARTVGDVIGKYHPHGDSASYEAMVTMAQGFNYRYPLIDGQGNWGSQDDPKSFASMRYTESRLTAYASTFLGELDQGTVDWKPNFDGSMKEPTLLPARLPNILINGATGIAVGMATDIPPHNLRELVTACLLLLKAPKTTLKEVIDIIQAPDYPTGCEIITPKEEVYKIYENGGGSLKLRAKWHQEDEGNIVITNLPHQVSPTAILGQIAEQMRNKKLPLVEDLRDEADYENPVRIVIIPRSNRVDVNSLMSHLFATTDLEKSVKVNLNMIGLDGRPKVKNPLEILQEWVSYRIATVRKRLEFRLKQVNDRLHILDGLLTAYLNLDRVIKIIREDDDPHAQLMEEFKLSEIQANAILDLRLRYLMKLEEFKIKAEQNELLPEKKKLEELLASDTKLKKLISKELEEDAIKYGDDRRSHLVSRPEAQAIKLEELTPAEPVTVILSKAGWIRAAKGLGFDLNTLTYRTGDTLLSSVEGKTNQSLVLFDSNGRAYSLSPKELPSVRSQGEPITTKMDLQPGSHVYDMILNNNEVHYVVGSKEGYGFIVKVEDLQARNRAGKIILTGSGPYFNAVQVNDLEKEFVAIVGSAGHLLIFPIKELPIIPKGKGNKLLNVKKDEEIIGVAVIKEDQSLLVESLGRTMTLKPADWKGYIGSRASRGSILPKGYTKVSSIKGAV